jgi:hypothetical protein
MRQHRNRSAPRITAALLAALAVVIGGAARARAQPLSPPDTHVASWDGVASQAFTASGLAATEGFVIFAYAGIAEYDSVVAIKGGYEPFAVDVDAPQDASPEAAVVAAAHAILVHYLPDQAATILDPAYGSRWGRSRTDFRQRPGPS